ncbi:type II toxin-antitoxin system VapC family toxin [Mycolicibacterium hippocampi]|uniref:Ribonuclease VapC n=1 Tax=Mycolicibacterium hippocampi TaxID=659824 RepID=A0A7I9ZHI2_9MYCO|nr:type II toxin-antitoxin system VapC family toxin [Mycolicibacterium hippocampi]GFH00329.1 ribonuclease VapC37 [Mycolicibacterium hippocampi]
MKLVDANVLVYAVNSASEHHEASRRWLDPALSGADIVGLAWVSLLAFARLTTKHGLFPSPLDPRDALVQIREWCAAPSAVLVQPSARHADVLTDLLTQVGAGGNLVNDAHLAALAIEHRGSVVTYDRDFARFDGIRWHTPESLLA